ncbi:N-acetyl-L,L-diaminopimelate deacetylase [Pseudonocardia sp. Ae168_Ps1]|uniref:amidohydrolase n=1 Tax=unclassified Pseudonocardia TaxID=2619320 RepID=UPI00094B3A0F|nr:MULTISPECIES: amidohydrolase [unclassified Pseudonocardia]OLL75529.1 N-acetyl-L,L-diaminopimelate deacetylase [Pseudonocardia sp. Ae150A_Ps1]OLL81524.1 N-acetyl-L,L-diaminopimelate deacetylase [Pseudonocardia sp. Ae168_Ps1]OLL84363.1 N-acetyl-L,L-diaminopimelate deacetylase [Pseudonocardia sp. Ae263_Ps1]OLL95619.1 N-acetyl-L,L-diaminopimelate deacetylase [Pseudonocardia sp. Ae356_Ps1]
MSTDLADLYRDLHRHPELSFAETRTAGIAADRLRAAGFEVTEGVGRTGVVGVLRNGDGPTALLRADMDALPVAEDTGLDYASTARGTGRDGEETAVAHACGHDVHVTCLAGAAAELASTRDTWSGTLLVVFQPAEEFGAGADAMLDDGLFERFGTPDVVLGQHVAPLPAGVLAITPGPAFAGSDTVRVTLHGSGGHGSRPETTVDPVLLAASTVQRLHAVVSREVPATETAVLTVGMLRAGTKENVIGDSAELGLTVRSYTPAVRTRVLGAIERIARGESAASGSPRDPDIRVLESFPPVVNDADAVERTRHALTTATALPVVDPGPVTGSEDVGRFAVAAGVPCAYWLLGGADPTEFAHCTSVDDIRERVAELPSNHSPRYAPVIEPTLSTGVAALTAAARAWLPPSA